MVSQIKILESLRKSMGSSMKILRSPMKVGGLSLLWKFWGSLMWIWRVFNENLNVSKENLRFECKAGISNDNLSVSNENLKLSNKNLGSPIISLVSSTKIQCLQWKDWRLQRKSGVYNENLGVSKENLWVSN